MSNIQKITRYLKGLLFAILYLPNLTFADVVYEKLGFKDNQGREVVSLKIEGDITDKDDFEFDKALMDINKNNYRVQFDSVLLDSSGGVTNTAINIGTAIRGNHLSTWVLPHSKCISACALILQGGVCKMADGIIGVHRARYTDPIPLDEVARTVENHENMIEQYLILMGTPPEYRSLFKIIPNWDMKYLANFEKRNYGLYSAISKEMQYRLEIASNKLGRNKEDLLEDLSITASEIYSEATWDTPDYVYAYPTCSQQLFLEDNTTDHIGINIEPETQDTFEIYQWDRGIVNEQGRYITTDRVPFKEEQFYYYSFRYFAKVKEVTYKERVTLSAPTSWRSDEEGIDYTQNKTPGYEVSEDKTTITVTRTIPNDGFVLGGWTLTKEDPKGPFKIEILFKDKVIRTFDYIIE